jgi:hypothetical protein
MTYIDMSRMVYREYYLLAHQSVYYQSLIISRYWMIIHFPFGGFFVFIIHMKFLLAFIVFIGAIFSTFTVHANGKEFSF